MGLLRYLERRENIRRVEAASRRQDNERVVRKLLALGAYDVAEHETEPKDSES